MDTPLLHPTPRDSWLAPVLRRLVPADAIEHLLAAPGESLWLTAVRRHLVSDAALLAEAAAVSGLEVWDGAPPDEDARALVGDDWARRYGIVATDASMSVLTIATATPFDLDCERALSFATGRAV